jgi:capsular polysaccharide transport system permease protein
VAQAIIKDCDEMIDGLTVRARQEEVRAAQGLVNQAEQASLKARMAMTEFQNLHGDINPPNSASQITGIVGALESQLVAQRANLAALQSGAPNSPQVKATKLQIASLEGQLKQEQGRLASKSGVTTYSKLLDEYSALQLQVEFTRSAYLSAQTGLSTAIADAASKQNYLVDFAPPYASDNQTLQYALFDSLTVLIASLLLLGVGSLLAGALRDQFGK